MRRIIPGWNDSQRGVLIAFLCAMLIVVGIRLWINSSYVSNPQPLRPSRFDELADKVDPNSADWQTLAALPQLGEKRARQVVAFREEFLAAHPGAIAFERANDLMQIRGIGKM